MSLVADGNFTNNLVSVSAFSPFPTGGGNKVLKMDTSGVLLDNTPALASLSQADLKVDALISNVAGNNIVGDFGFIVNRNGSGKFYYLRMLPTNASPGKAQFAIYRYSGGVGGSFTLLKDNQDILSVYADNTIFSFRAIVKSTNNGPLLTMLFNDEAIISYQDDSVNKITSGQPGLAANLIDTGTKNTRYSDNWFVRHID